MIGDQRRIPSISVVTATRNCADLIPGLIASLRAQSDQEFEWVVVDGMSSDGTAELVRQSGVAGVSVVSESDFGIYDALNRGVKRASGDYYMVLGADDTANADAIARFKAAIAAESGIVGIVAAGVIIGGRLRCPKRGGFWLRGGNAFVASHAVGTAIRRSLHHEHGYYSNRYPNAADMHFISKVGLSDPNCIVRSDFVAGVFAIGGISTADSLTSITDVFRLQIEFRGARLLQLALMVFRVARSLIRSSVSEFKR